VKAAYAYDVAALKKFKKHASINHASKLLDASIKRQIERHVIDHLKSYQ